MAYTDQEKDKWLEIAQDTGDSIETSIPVLALNDMDNSVSIPGVVFTGIEYDEEGNVTSLGKPQGYAQLPLGTLGIKTKAASDAADTANAAAVRANAASDGAEKVDATLVGMKVTITDRNGDARSVNIGFEIESEHVYPSITDMNADAANVLAGKFCMIATTDPTSTENAQLWSRNSEPATSEHPFTFLSDLDQAATHAWDDWNTNLRQGVVDATNSANTAATNANNKASVANTAATNANTATTKANTATANANTATANANNAAAYANTQGDYSKNMADHPAYIGEDNYWYIWNYAQQKYVKSSYAKGDDLDWDSMTEAEKQALADEVLSHIAFDSKPTSGSRNAVTSGGIYTALGNREKIIEASVATSQSIVDELT